MGETIQVYTRDEVAALLRVPVRTVQGYVRAGKLKPLVLGKYVRFTEEAVREFLRGGTAGDGFARLSAKGRRNAAKRGARAEEKPAPPAPEAAKEEPAVRVPEEVPAATPAPPPAGAVPAHFSEAVREAETSARRNGWNVSALAARALSLYPEDPKLAEVVLVELSDRASLAEWKAEERRAEAAGEAGEAKEARRRIHDMRLRQHGRPDRLEPRFADALRELHAERPEELRPVPRKTRAKA